MAVAPGTTVLHVTAPAAFGGLERVVSALARGMRIRGHPVHVLALLDVGVADHPLVQELREVGVPVTAHAVPPRAYGVERVALRRTAEACGARVVHTHGARPDVVDGPAARRLGLATVSTLHGFTAGGLKNRLYEWLQVRSVRSCDGVVAVSRPIADRLRASGVPAERVHVIPNAWSPGAAPLDGPEARGALAVSPEPYRIGWVGRLTPEKGADVLLDATELLGDLPVAVSFLGDGPRRHTLERASRAAGLGERVRWHGTVPDGARLMRAFDLFVLSSRTEGTPIALFEAIAAGVPVVVTAVGGVPDVVTEREAILVPPGQPAALAAAIRRAYGDSAAAARRAVAAAERLATHFAVEPWLDAYERTYLDIAGGVRTGQGE